jgi:hypothetical protein
MLTEEALIALGEEVLGRMRVIFDSCKEGDNNEVVNFNQLIATMSEDEVF